MITVYGIEFKNLSTFFKVLGYKRPLSASTVEDQYENLEGVVKARLGVSDDKMAMQKLKELVSQKDNTSDIELAIYKSAWQLITPDQQKTIISAIASVYNMKTDDVYKIMNE